MCRIITTTQYLKRRKKNTNNPDVYSIIVNRCEMKCFHRFLRVRERASSYKIESFIITDVALIPEVRDFNLFSSSSTSPGRYILYIQCLHFDKFPTRINFKSKLEVISNEDTLMSLTLIQNNTNFAFIANFTISC